MSVRSKGRCTLPDCRASHYLVINRFDDECGDYHRFAEGVDCRLSFITLEAGRDVIDEAAALEVIVVPDLRLDLVRDQMRALITRHGPLAAIVGISERDVLMTAQLRDEFGLPGWKSDFVRRFRDKPLMKSYVAAAGLRVPRFMALHGETQPGQLIARIGLPLVLKPRAEGASRGVVVIRSAGQLRRALERVDLEAFECEEYIEGNVLHVDGLRRDGKFYFASAARKLNTCLDFANGARMGTVLLDPGEERDAVIDHAGACLDALGLVEGPFHLEMFQTLQGEHVFLEVGIRPGGSEVPFVNRDLFGIDLFGEAFRVTLGLPPMIAQDQIRPPGESGGWVAVPEPRPLPSRLLARNSLIGRIPELYAEVLPAVGTIFRGDGGYDHIGGRFRLRGPDGVSVEKAVRRVMREYRLAAEVFPSEVATPA
jgi:ATP-grasp domain